MPTVDEHLIDAVEDDRGEHMVATLAFEIPEELAEALALLDGSLLCDGVLIERLLREHAYKASDELVSIVEGGEDLDADQLRSIARQLDAVAAAVDALQEPDCGLRFPEAAQVDVGDEGGA
ncbi:MAG: hypothetical protein ACTHMY_18020 [Solirubrobacteraceae bacterium]